MIKDKDLVEDDSMIKKIINHFNDGLKELYEECGELPKNIVIDKFEINTPFSYIVKGKIEMDK